MSQDSNLYADVIVVGGGMIGSAVAIGFAARGFSVAVIDPFIPPEVDLNTPPDCRISAVSASSITLLDSLGVWASVEAMRSQPYHTMSVWEESWSRVDLTASSIQLPLLGHMVENQILQRCLFDACQAHDNITWYAVGFESLTGLNNKQVKLSNSQVISGHLVIGADGGHSRVRQSASIGTSGWQYNQQVLGVVVSHSGEFDPYCTWQKFEPTGPLAYLPLSHDYGCFIWYNDADKLNQLMAVSDTELAASIANEFPVSDVEFTVVNKAKFPIHRHHAHRYFKDNVVLVGDAAHSINPLAGQGLNLGFLDISALLNCFDNWQPTMPVHTRAREYETQRRRHNQTVMNAMDVFYQSFSNTNLLLKVARNAALYCSKNQSIQTKILRYTLGL